MDIASKGSLTASDIVVRSATILGADVGSDFVALDAERGVCYSLNRVGSRIWQLIGEPTKIEALCAQLVAEFNVDATTCEQQTLDLLNELKAEGLLSVGPAAAATPRRD